MATSDSAEKLAQVAMLDERALLQWVVKGRWALNLARVALLDKAALLRWVVTLARAEQPDKVAPRRWVVTLARVVTVVSVVLREKAEKQALAMQVEKAAQVV